LLQKYAKEKISYKEYTVATNDDICATSGGPCGITTYHE